jgi:hypothetical protein
MKFKLVDDEALNLAILLVVGLGVAYGAYKLISAMITAAENGATSAIASVGAAIQDALTGNNALTANSPNSNGAYVGAGIFGELGAETNDILGGVPAAFGNWLGGEVYTVLNPNAPGGSVANQPATTSDAIQSSTKNPYAVGTDASYADAADSSPVSPQDMATSTADTDSGGD